MHWLGEVAALEEGLRYIAEKKQQAERLRQRDQALRPDIAAAGRSVRSAPGDSVAAPCPPLLRLSLIGQAHSPLDQRAELDETRRAQAYPIMAA
jgi:hypothetical protein